MASGSCRFLGNVVHQIVNVEDIACCEDTGNAGFQAFVDGRAVGHRIQLHARSAAELIFGDQATGKKQCITLVMLLRAGDGFSVFHPGQSDALHSGLTLNVHHGMAQLQRNAVVIQTLDDIPLQAARVRHQLGHDLYLRTFQGHTASHNQTDITGTQNDDFPARQISLHVHQTLGSTRGVDTGRTIARDIQGASGTLPAAHCQNNRFGFQSKQAILPVHGGYGFILRQVENHGVELVGDLQLPDLLDKSAGIFGAGKLFLKGMEAEAVVDALVENAAQLVVAFQNQNILNTAFSGCHCCCKARGAAANDDKIIVFHWTSPPFRLSLLVPTISLDVPPDLVISLWETPSSRARISMTLGLQKPP